MADLLREYPFFPYFHHTVVSAKSMVPHLPNNRFYPVYARCSRHMTLFLLAYMALLLYGQSSCKPLELRMAREKTGVVHFFDTVYRSQMPCSIVFETDSNEAGKHVIAEFPFVNDTDSVLKMNRFWSCAGWGYVDFSHQQGGHHAYIDPHEVIIFRFIDDSKAISQFRVLLFVLTLNDVANTVYMRTTYQASP